ncbi:class I SAM-dependent methyltransferase [Kitasatospora aureofaciens]|uniref:class I SAM-dependent methyltransferase n=1 Tax=Kitasatospora aureofaciens TaxID=1894 RepID=UPI001C444C0A|nr:methyltransferase domain-containing protein [Kitasatospora aureofaciens]MBV6703061.1 methyltransferase domain-containing protein [Kitasatospora aureofaciens]
MRSRPHIELDSPTPEAIDGRHIRALSFQAVRMEYLAKVAPDGTGRRALVVGGGRGLPAAGLARLGYRVTAVDPSPIATEYARAAHERDGLAIASEVADAEELPFADGEFDLAYCADTFEVTADLDRVLAHAARILRPGGTLVYDTVNRTPLSRLIYLGAFQAIPATRIMPPHRYAAARLRTPAELTAALARHGLHNRDICDFKPRDPRTLIQAILARRAGRITDDEIPPLVDFVLSPAARPVVTYLGHARKPAYLGHARKPAAGG